MSRCSSEADFWQCSCTTNELTHIFTPLWNCATHSAAQNSLCCALHFTVTSQGGALFILQGLAQRLLRWTSHGLTFGLSPAGGGQWIALLFVFFPCSPRTKPQSSAVRSDFWGEATHDVRDTVLASQRTGTNSGFALSLEGLDWAKQAKACWFPLMAAD